MHTERFTSPLTYVVIFLALGLFTGLTVWAAYLPLGRWSDPVALAIASTKAILVVLFFMHALHSSRLIAFSIFVAIGTLVIMFGLTFSDYLTRHTIMEW